MLAAGALLRQAGSPVLAGIFGIGCDAELTPAEVLAGLARAAAAGGVLGARGLTAPVAERIEQAIRRVPTEASAQAVRAFRGASGIARIRGGRRELELSTAAALTFYLEVGTTLAAAAPLARAVLGARSLEHANDLLHERGVRTELDLERELAGAGASAAADRGAGFRG
jgi:hypothetical protein